MGERRPGLAEREKIAADSDYASGVAAVVYCGSLWTLTASAVVCVVLWVPRDLETTYPKLQRSLSRSTGPSQMLAFPLG